MIENIFELIKNQIYSTNKNLIYNEYSYKTYSMAMVTKSSFIFLPIRQVTYLNTTLDFFCLFRKFVLTVSFRLQYHILV